MKYRVSLIVETDLPEDITADANVETYTILDVGNGQIGIVGRVLFVSIRPIGESA